MSDAASALAPRSHPQHPHPFLAPGAADSPLRPNQTSSWLRASMDIDAALPCAPAVADSGIPTGRLQFPPYLGTQSSGDATATSPTASASSNSQQQQQQLQRAHTGVTPAALRAPVLAGAALAPTLPPTGPFFLQPAVQLRASMPPGAGRSASLDAASLQAAARELRPPSSYALGGGLRMGPPAGPSSRPHAAARTDGGSGVGEVGRGGQPEGVLPVGGATGAVEGVLGALSPPSLTPLSASPVPSPPRAPAAGAGVGAAGSPQRRGAPGDGFASAFGSVADLARDAEGGNGGRRAGGGASAAAAPVWRGVALPRSAESEGGLQQRADLSPAAAAAEPPTFPLPAATSPDKQPPIPLPAHATGTATSPPPPEASAASVQTAAAALALPPNARAALQPVTLVMPAAAVPAAAAAGAAALGQAGAAAAVAVASVASATSTAAAAATTPPAEGAAEQDVGGTTMPALTLAAAAAAAAAAAVPAGGRLLASAAPACVLVDDGRESAVPALQVRRRCGAITAATLALACVAACAGSHDARRAACFVWASQAAPVQILESTPSAELINPSASAPPAATPSLAFTPAVPPQRTSTGSRHGSSHPLGDPVPRASSYAGSSASSSAAVTPLVTGSPPQRQGPAEPEEAHASSSAVTVIEGEHRRGGSAGSARSVTSPLRASPIDAPADGERTKRLCVSVTLSRRCREQKQVRNVCVHGRRRLEPRAALHGDGVWRWRRRRAQRLHPPGGRDGRRSAVPPRGA